MADDKLKAIDAEIEEAQEELAADIRAILQETPIEPTEFLFDTQEFTGEDISINFKGKPRQPDSGYLEGVYRIKLMGDTYQIRYIG